MDAASIPTRFPIPFAEDAGPSYIRAIPTASQIGIEDGAASLTDGFPPDTFVPVGAGGIPPFGQDFNGLFYQVTAWLRWVQAGGAPVAWNSTFNTAIGGYPAGAVVTSPTDAARVFVSAADNNTTDPDDAASTTWREFHLFNGAATTSGANTVTVAPSPAWKRYSTDMVLQLKMGSANSGPVTLNVNGLGAKDLRDPSNAALSAGAYAAGEVITVAYNGTSFQILSAAPVAGFIRGMTALGAIVGDETVPLYSPTEGGNRGLNLGVFIDYVVQRSAAFNVAAIIPGQPYHTPEHLLQDGTTYSGPSSTVTNTLYLVPFSRQLEIDAVCLWAMATGGTYFLGLYSAGADGMPDTLLDQSVLMNATTTGSKVGLLVNGPIELSGLVWLAVLFRNTGIGAFVNMANGVAVAAAGAILGGADANMAAPVVGLYAAGVTGSPGGLPSTPPALSVITSNAPLLSVRGA